MLSPSASGALLHGRFSGAGTKRDITGSEVESAGHVDCKDIPVSAPLLRVSSLEEEDALRGENHAINSNHHRCAAKSRIASITIFPSSIAMKRKRVSKAESAMKSKNRNTCPLAINRIP